MEVINWSIDLKDTAFGPLAETKKRECIASVYVMSKEERAAMRLELDKAEEVTEESENKVLPLTQEPEDSVDLAAV